MNNILSFVAYNNDILVNALLQSIINSNIDISSVTIFNNGNKISILPLISSKLNINILENNTENIINYTDFFL